MSDIAEAVKAGGERRIALVIGNAKYVVGRPLINTERDATGIADALHMLGVVSHIRGPNGEYAELTAVYDQTLIEMKRLLADFSVEAGDADMAIIYYSGHGIEIDFRNFLIPVDAALSHVDRLAYEGVPLGEVIAAASKARKLRLVILDACRDNPLVPRMKNFDPGKSGSSIGLGPPGSGISALIFYAAAEGQRARQGSPLGRSPFAEALITRILQPLELARVFGLVTDDVRTATDGQQEPRLYGPPQRDDVFLLARPDRPTPSGEPLPAPRPQRRSDRDPKTRRRAFLIRLSSTASFSIAGAVILAGTYVYLATSTGFVTYNGQNDFFIAAIARAGLPASEATYKALRLAPEMSGRRLKLLSFSSFEGTLNDLDWQGGGVQTDELALPRMYRPRLIGPMVTDRDAVSGRNSMNFAPAVIPAARGYAVLTAMKHRVLFDVSGMFKVWVRYDVKSNTNPHPASQHNCESALRMQGRFDGDEWKVHNYLCGNYPGESDYWARHMFSFPVPPGAKTFQFAMDMIMQDNPTEMKEEMKDRYFLIDNAVIIGEQ